jgi:hypothetical protein
MGVEARCRPSKCTAHCRHMKRQPFLCNGRPRRGRCHCHCHCRCHLRRRRRLHRRRRCHSRCNQTLPLPLLSAIAIAVAVNHRRGDLCCKPSDIAVAVALAIGHCRLCHRWPSQLPLLLAITVAMLLAISESCCLSATKFVFNQVKQRMLTLFYFVQTVGGALIKAG